jgi:hypothetical protein
MIISRARNTVRRLAVRVSNSRGANTYFLIAFPTAASRPGLCFFRTRPVICSAIAMNEGSIFTFGVFSPPQRTQGRTQQTSP